jgi:hypothetical protein
MNHQPFRDWLLSDDHLSAVQIKELQNHLDTCESCSHIESSWKEVELALRKSSQVEPASGFTVRWQEHLAEYQLHQQSRNSWLTIMVTALIATSLLVLLITQIWSLIQAPGPYLEIWLNRLVGVISVYFLLHNMINSYFWSIPIYTFVGMFFVVGFISFMSVLWLTAYRKFSLARRVA